MMGGEPTRRLAAILSADVVGYSRLIAADEDATVERLGACRAEIRGLIDRHRGRLADFTGDNFLAEFPTALEAVQCAVEIQRTIEGLNADVPEDRRMRFRIGAHLGDIREEDDRLYGEGINIAARLETLAPAGGICMSDAVYGQVRNKLDLPIQDGGPRSLKNIAEPIHTYLMHFDETALPRIPTLAPGGTRVIRAFQGAAAVLAVALGLAWWLRPAHTAQAPAAPAAAQVRPNLAVLPFENRSDSPDQVYFALGMTDDLTTDLGKVQGLSVIAGTSARHYQDTTLSAPEIAAELGVQFLVTGNVRRERKTVRINVELVSGQTGAQLWSERFDRNASDIFALQDDVAARVVQQLRGYLQLGSGALAAVPPTQNRDAYDLYLQAVAYLDRQTREAVLHSRDLFQQAIALDPDFADAYSGLAMSYFLEYVSNWSTDPATISRAVTAAERAVELNPTLPIARSVLGRVYTFDKRYEDGLRETREGVRLAPGDARTLGALGEALYCNGRPEEALESLVTASRLDPLNPYVTFYRGGAYVFLRDYDSGIEYLRKALAMNPDIFGAHVFLAIAYAEAGDQERAQAEVREILRISPGSTIAGFSQRVVLREARDRERVEKALRNAGLPDGGSGAGVAG